MGCTPVKLITLKAFGSIVIPECFGFGIEPAKAVAGAQPQVAFVVFPNSINGVVWQPFRFREV